MKRSFTRPWESQHAPVVDIQMNVAEEEVEDGDEQQSKRQGKVGYEGVSVLSVSALSVSALSVPASETQIAESLVS